MSTYIHGRHPFALRIEISPRVSISRPVESSYAPYNIETAAISWKTQAKNLDRIFAKFLHDTYTAKGQKVPDGIQPRFNNAEVQIYWDHYQSFKKLAKTESLLKNIPNWLLATHPDNRELEKLTYEKTLAIVGLQGESEKEEAFTPSPMDDRKDPVEPPSVPNRPTTPTSPNARPMQIPLSPPSTPSSHALLQPPKQPHAQPSLSSNHPPHRAPPPVLSRHAPPFIPLFRAPPLPFPPPGFYPYPVPPPHHFVHYHHHVVHHLSFAPPPLAKKGDS